MQRKEPPSKPTRSIKGRLVWGDGLAEQAAMVVAGVAETETAAQWEVDLVSPGVFDVVGEGRRFEAVRSDKGKKIDVLVDGQCFTFKAPKPPPAD